MMMMMMMMKERGERKGLLFSILTPVVHNGSAPCFLGLQGPRQPHNDYTDGKMSANG
jgi:hypothetical protein